MKKLLSILILSALPALALASGDHTSGHDMNGMEGMKGMKGMEGMQGMEGMSHGWNEGAVGRPGDPAKVSRTIEVTMDDTMRLTPNQINVTAGETVRFFLKNTGKMPHEMMIGSMDELKEHAEMMRKMPDMKHAMPNMARLDPGQRGGIVWQFDKPGKVDFACLVPGHMEAGMVGMVKAE